MARVAQKHRPKLEYGKGAKVTLPELQFHGTVVDRHVSYRVRRGDAEIVVGEDEDVDGITGEPLDVHVSYLVQRQWDNSQVWVEPQHVVAGHDMQVCTASLQPAASTTPAGAR